MKQFNAKANIKATPQEIWKVLTEIEKYPEWDPYCIRIEGTLALGAKLKAFSKLSPGRAFPVKVTELTDSKKMAWSGGMPFGLFNGTRTFELIAQEDGSTNFEMKEVFSGPFLALIGKSIPDMTEAFDKFAKMLGLPYPGGVEIDKAS